MSRTAIDMRTGEITEDSLAVAGVGLPVRVPRPAEFWGDYLDGTSLEPLRAEVLSAYPDLQWLQKYRVRLVWKRKASKSKGKVTAGKCILASGLTAFFGDCDYVIWLAADVAREKPRLWLGALLHHELLHCTYEEEESEDEGDEPKVILKVRGHDFEGFRLELERYGAWDNDLKLATAAFQQLPLFEPAQ